MTSWEPEAPRHLKRSSATAECSSAWRRSDSCCAAPGTLFRKHWTSAGLWPFSCVCGSGPASLKRQHFVSLFCRTHSQGELVWDKIGSDNIGHQESPKYFWATLRISDTIRKRLQAVCFAWNSWTIFQRVLKFFHYFQKTTQVFHHRFCPNQFYLWPTPPPRCGSCGFPCAKLTLGHFRMEFLLLQQRFFFRISSTEKLLQTSFKTCVFPACHKRGGSPFFRGGGSPSSRRCLVQRRKIATPGWGLESEGS